MKFGEIPTADAGGSYLAHSLKGDGFRFKKGHFLDPASVKQLLDAGVETVIAAQLFDGDVHEETAATRVAGGIVGEQIRLDPPFTGRVNFFADCDGLLVVDRVKVDALNTLDPAITFATLENYTCVEKGRMVATVKVIPFSAPETAVAAAANLGAMLEVRPFKPMRVALIATVLPGLKDVTMDKTRRVLDERLKRFSSSVVKEVRVPHQKGAVEDALNGLSTDALDLIIIFGASATVDREDVAPAGLVAAGGAVEHFGMPVDPGNLLFVGDLRRVPVVGAPGCARSPAENGFDWVLERIAAGMPMGRHDIIGLGVGGLLMEIVSRPQPRGDVMATSNKITGIILAAGRSTRMGGPNKLLATLDGIPLVRRVANAMLASKVDDVLVVTGHMADEVAAALEGLSVRLVNNPDFAEGLSTSLKTGIKALPSDVDATVIALGDMPFVTDAAFDSVLDAYTQDDAVHAVVATSNGKRGNPVLWSRRFFDDLKAIQGDTGARHLIGAHGSVITEVEIGEAGALDLDTQDALHAVGGVLPDAK